MGHFASSPARYEAPKTTPPIGRGVEAQSHFVGEFRAICYRHGHADATFGRMLPGKPHCHRFLATLTTSFLAVASVGGAGCKEITQAFVEKSVKVAKDTTKGIEAGFEQGRKAGESSDGALIASRFEELAGKATIKIHMVRPGADATTSEVDFAVENTMDRPLRITDISAVGLDSEGFAQRPSSAIEELTVPAKAKELLTVAFNKPAGQMAKIRLWDVEYDLAAAKLAK